MGCRSIIRGRQLILLDHATPHCVDSLAGGKQGCDHCVENNSTKVAGAARELPFH